MDWTHANIPDQTGRVAIVTGANSGIGFETAKSLAHRGATVVMACRNMTKGEAALSAIREAAVGATVDLRALDLSSLSSVKSFAEGFLEDYDQLDMLINNAGVMMTPLSRTADGFELQLGTNHLGHFALTGHLLDRLTATVGSRVVNVSSIAHRMGKIDFDNLNAERSYKKVGAYAQSKLANLLFTQELMRRLQRQGHETVVTAAHPGWTATNLQADIASFRIMGKVIAQTPAMGALPTLYAATAPEAKTGGYYGPRKMMEWRGTPGPAKIAKRVHDQAVAQRLWDVSQQLTGVSYLA